MDPKIHVLCTAFAQWAVQLLQHWEMKARKSKELLIAARKDIADQRAVMEAQAKIILLLWVRQRVAPAQHTDDVVDDYSSLSSKADKMSFYSD